MNNRHWAIEVSGNDDAITTFAIAEEERLLLMMIDWDRHPSAEHISLARRALDAARASAASFPSDAISRLHDELCRAPWIARDFGVAAGAVAVTGADARVAWVGDVRVEVNEGGQFWASQDHTLQNDAARSGQALPDALAGTAPSILVRAAGPIGPFDIERRDFVSGSVDGVALSAKSLHRHAPNDHRTWPSSRVHPAAGDDLLLQTPGIRARPGHA